MKTTYLSSAKINFLLKVTGRRSGGYHEIFTIFQKVSLFDTLVFEARDDGKVELLCDIPNIPTDERNLVVKAALALKALTNKNVGVNVNLKKKIAVAAGLGGGSSNAATTLMVLNRLWNINAPDEKLAKLAVGLGADVPFFLSGPAAFAKGVGEKLTPLLPEKSVPLLLVNPGFGLSAEDAYRESNFKFEPFNVPHNLTEIIKSGDPAQIASHMENDLEPWALEKSMELNELKRKIENTTPIPLKVMVSGSGPTLIAIYASPAEATKAQKRLKGTVPFLTCVETLTTDNQKPA